MMDRRETNKRFFWFAIGILAFLAFPSLIRGQWPLSVFYAFAALFYALAGYGIVTGKVFIKNPREHQNKGWCSRSEQPFYYWLGIGIYVFAATSILFCLR